MACERPTCLLTVDVHQPHSRFLYFGFENAVWGTDSFTHVGREGEGIYLCRGGQGHKGAWVWIGVGDVRALYQAYKDHGAIIRQEPKNQPWASKCKSKTPTATS